MLRSKLFCLRMFSKMWDTVLLFSGTAHFVASCDPLVVGLVSLTNFLEQGRWTNIVKDYTYCSSTLDTLFCIIAIQPCMLRVLKSSSCWIHIHIDCISGGCITIIYAYDAEQEARNKNKTCIRQRRSLLGLTWYLLSQKLIRASSTLALSSGVPYSGSNVHVCLPTKSFVLYKYGSLPEPPSAMFSLHILKQLCKGLVAGWKYYGYLLQLLKLENK